jgi:DNA-directed RNA polymerase specialized sigma24 family protein
VPPERCVMKPDDPNRPPEPDARLNQINTLWSVVRQAHDDTGEKARAARQALLLRYGGAIQRYLLGALRDEESANDLAQDFAYRFLHGDLRGADPTRGRFRDFVKGVLFHMVADYHSKRKRQPALLSSSIAEPGQDCSLAAEREEAYRTAWRDELIARAWQALKVHEKEQNQPFYTVLRFRADNPNVPSAEMAEKLTGPLGKSVTAAGVRKTLERARDKFGDLLLEEIAQAVDSPSRSRLEEELIELRLLEHCRSALDRRCP